MESDKVAIVTGGSSGLGLAITKKFVEKGITTIITARTQSKLDEVKSELGDKCIPYAFDMDKLDEIPGLIRDIESKFGRIDILVNNAGINMKKEMLEVTDAEFHKIIQTNVLSLFSISREVAKVMVNQGSGSIINISSMAAIYGIPKVIAYSASKSAVEGMTRAMAADLSPKGIRVNCIAPGFIKTPMSAKALDNDPERKNKVLSRTPLGKMGDPVDIANMAYFLASDESAYLSGTHIPVDGGNSIGF